MERPTKGTQAERLLTWMEAGHKVTPLDSWELLGIYRLSDVVLKLRKRGYNIVTHDAEVPNKYGETVTVGEYELKGTNPEPDCDHCPVSNKDGCRVCFNNPKHGGAMYQDEMFKVR